MVYLIHFEKAYKHSKHYIGYVNNNLAARMKRHFNGDGARLLQVINNAGIKWKLVRVWPDGDRTLERKLKHHSATRQCPICSSNKKKYLFKTRSKKLKPFTE